MTEPTTGTKHTAGAFDIRNFIGTLLAIFGIILLAMGLFADKELDKTGGVNANLLAGIALAVVGAVFVTWARLKPIVVPDHIDPPDGRAPEGSVVDQP